MPPAQDFPFGTVVEGRQPQVSRFYFEYHVPPSRCWLRREVDDTDGVWAQSVLQYVFGVLGVRAVIELHIDGGEGGI